MKGFTQGNIMTATETQTNTEKRKVIIGKFNGAFSGFQIRAFNDLKYAGFDELVAHHIAADFAADMGNAMAKGDEMAAKINKAKKDGDSIIKIGGKGLTKMSNTMSLLRVVQIIADLKSEKLVDSYKIDKANLAEPIREYIAKCEKNVLEWEVITPTKEA